MKIHKNKGYSLIEIVVYLAIFSALSVLVINSFIVILGSFNTTRANRDLLQSGSKTMERLSREIRQAESVDLVNSTLGSSPGVLQLNSRDSAGTPMTVRFAIASGNLNLYENGTLVDNLVMENISPTSLIFRRIATTNSEAVKIELTVQDTSSTSTKTENFYNTVILRGTY